MRIPYLLSNEIVLRNSSLDDFEHEGCFEMSILCAGNEFLAAFQGRLPCVFPEHTVAVLTGRKNRLQCNVCNRIFSITRHLLCSFNVKVQVVVVRSHSCRRLNDLE